MLTEATRLQSFPSLVEMTYLNTAAEGIPPLEVHAALDQYFRDKQMGHEGRAAHAAQRDAVKELTARFFGLTPDEIGLTSCSSEAYNLAARALQLGLDDEVIVNDLDFPAGITPWLPPNSPVTLRLWRARAGGLRVEDLPALLTPRTRLLTVSMVSFFNGFRIDLPALVEIVRRHSSALVAVDVTQALGRIPLDLSGADLIVSSTHKWILASHGGGLVGVPSARAGTWTVPAGGWYNLENAFGPDRFAHAVHRRGAASFSVGMPNYPALYAIRAGLEYIDRIGVPAIDAAARPLVLACLEELRRLPVELLTPAEPAHLAGILAFRHPDMEAIDRALRAQRIYLMAQAGRMRISLHGYNTAADVERLLGALVVALHYHTVH